MLNTKTTFHSLHGTIPLSIQALFWEIFAIFPLAMIQKHGLHDTLKWGCNPQQGREHRDARSKSLSEKSVSAAQMLLLSNLVMYTCTTKPLVARNRTTCRKLSEYKNYTTLCFCLLTCVQQFRVWRVLSNLLSFTNFSSSKGVFTPGVLFFLPALFLHCIPM